MKSTGLMHKITTAWKEWRRKAAEAHILRNMSDRELSDLALTRVDVERIIDGTYVDPREEIRAHREAAKARRTEAVNTAEHRIAA